MTPIRHLTGSAFRGFLPLLALVALVYTAPATHADSVIFEDTFDDFSQWAGPGGNPEPDDPAERILEITDENSEVYFGEEANPYVRFYKAHPESANIHITANNAFSEPSEVITVRFDYWDNPEVGPGHFTMMVSSESGVAGTDFFHRLQLGQGVLSGNPGLYRPGQPNRIELVMNNSHDAVTYLDGDYTVESDTMDVWVNGVPVLDNFEFGRGSYEDLPVGTPLASMRLAIFTIQQAELLIDDLVVHSGAVIEEVADPPPHAPPLVEFTFDDESLENTGMLAGEGAFDETERRPAFGPGLLDGTAMDNSSASGMGLLAAGDGEDGALKYDPGAGLNNLVSITVTGWFRTDAHFNNRAMIMAKPNSFQIEGRDNMFQFNPLTRVDGVRTSRWLRSSTNWHQETGQWIFFAVTADVREETEGTDNAFMYYAYEDSEGITLDATQSFVTGAVDNVSPPLAIGNFVNDHPFQGRIDNVRIWGSGIDGSGALTPAEIEAVWAQDLGMDIDPPVEPEIPSVRLFWSEHDLGEIHTAQADGEGREVLVNDLNRPIGVAIDEDTGHLYWAEDGVDSNTTGDGVVGRANLDGSDAVTLYAATEGDDGLDNPQFIALHTEAGLIYWADHQNGIYRAPIDGTGPVESVYIDTNQRFTNLALDLVNEHIYFGNPQTGDLFRTDLDGGNHESLASGLTGTWAFNGLAVDPDQARIYFPDTSTVNSGSLSGDDVQTLASALNTPLGVALGPDRDHVFFAERGGQRIGSVKTDGTQQQTLITGLDNPFGVAGIARAVDVTYNDWASEYFSDTELGQEEVSGPHAQPARDGIPNIIKYAFDLNPHQSGHHGLPEIAFSDGEMTLSYLRRTTVADIIYHIDISDDLDSWVPANDQIETVETENIRDGLERVTVTPTDATGDRLFLRVRIEQN